MENDKKQISENINPGASVPPVGQWDRINWILLVFGVVILAIGFAVLHFVDARAENWAGSVAPPSIILGYVLIFLSIIIRTERVQR